MALAATRLPREFTVRNDVADDGMVVHELQLLLFGGFLLDEHSHVFQPKRPITLGDLASLVDFLVRVLVRQRQQSHHCTQALNTAISNHRLGPSFRVFADRSRLPQHPISPPFDTMNLLGGDMLGVGAELTWANLHVDGDFFPSMVEDSYEPAVPSDPDFPGEILGRCRVVTAIDFNMTVSINRTFSLVKKRKAIWSQGSENRSLFVLERPSLLVASSFHEFAYRRPWLPNS